MHRFPFGPYLVSRVTKMQRILSPILNITRNLGAASCLLFLGSAGALSQDQAPSIHSINESISKSIASGEVAGAVTLVVDGQSTLHIGAAGYADVEQQTPLREDSIFWIASMSKPVTAACVMILVDERKIALSDPIDKYLPEMKNLRIQSNESVVITVEQVLNHTSGMSEVAKGTYGFATLKDAAEAYSKLPVLFPPGSKWQYSQTGINTAARIVEVVSGQTFSDFLQKRICEPLGMKDTSFYLSEVQLKRLSKSYNRVDGKFIETPISLLAGHSPTDTNRFPAANGGLFSTARDYGRFCQMLLNDGTLDGKTILSPAAVLTLRTPTTKDLTTGFTEGNAWGVGCCVVRKPQGATESLSAGSFGHGGAYGTQAWIDPVKKRAYILMVQRGNFPNADNSDLRKAFQAVAAQAR